MSSKDLTEILKFYLFESEKALNKLNENRAGIRKIDDLEFQIALGEKLGLDPKESRNVIDAMLNSQEMIGLLNDYPFSSHEVIFSFRLEEDILEGISGKSLLVEKRMKVGGYIWEVHKNDIDPFPSNPHAHDVESERKLHLGSGEIFLKKNPVGKIKDKHLMQIRDLLISNGFALPALL